MSDIEKIIAEKNEEIKAKYPYSPETWISISMIKERIRKPFDREGIAKKTFDKNYNNEKSQYYHKSVEEIMQMWEDKAERSRQIGTMFDSFMEFMFMNMDVIDKDIAGVEKYISDRDAEARKTIIGEGLADKLHRGLEFLRDIKKRDIEFLCREQTLLMPFEFNGKTYVVNGRFDAMLRGTTGLNSLIDWKTNDEIKTSNYFEKLLGPCSKLDQCDAVNFTIQLYMYKYMLDTVYGIPCHTTMIVQAAQDGKENVPYCMMQPVFLYDPDLMAAIVRYVLSDKNENGDVIVPKEQRLEMFRNELDMIKNPMIKSFCEDALCQADDYFFSMPASTTGKYHPDFALGEGGLVRHTRAVTFVAASLAEAEGFESDTIDAIITAAICHDIKKKGEDGSQFTTKDHPECAARYMGKIYESMNEDARPVGSILKMIQDAIVTHMGKWGNTAPESRIQMLLHEADYVASRKVFNMNFDAVNDVLKSDNVKINENCEPGDVVMPFGKHSGKTIKEIAAEAPGYLKWIAGNEEFHNEEIKSAVIRFLEK